MIETNDAQTVFKIPSANVATFEQRFAKIARKAIKLNVPIPTFTIIGEEVVERTKDGKKYPVLLHLITISSPVVKLSGYTFVATIEHTEDGNILHSRSSSQLPVQYRTVSPLCQHCNTVRRRNDTFLVQNDATLSYMQVGRNCLCDFLGGRDAETYAATAELTFELDELASASEDYIGGESSGREHDYLDVYLGFVAECIARNGWLSRGQAKEQGGKSTADCALSALYPSPFDRSERIYPSAESIATAKASIEWAIAITDADSDGSDYLYTIRLIARRGIVGSRHHGFAASIVSGYQRHLGDLKRREREAVRGASSEFVGEVGKRLTFTVNVEKAVSLPDYGYGSSTLYIMYDHLGNCLTWKSSTSPVDAGDTVVLKGTVKEHKTYNGTLQTILTRCKVEHKVA